MHKNILGMKPQYVHVNVHRIHLAVPLLGLQSHALPRRRTLSSCPLLVHLVSKTLINLQCSRRRRHRKQNCAWRGCRCLVHRDLVCAPRNHRVESSSAAADDTLIERGRLAIRGVRPMASRMVSTLLIVHAWGVIVNQRSVLTLIVTGNQK